jgi:hypothetical protein
MPYMTTHVLGSPGHWRMLPTSASGQPAVAAYYRSSDGTYLPYGIVVQKAPAPPLPPSHRFLDALHLQVTDPTAS